MLPTVGLCQDERAKQADPHNPNIHIDVEQDTKGNTQQG
jgi:hypothetical protein